MFENIYEFLLCAAYFGILSLVVGRVRYETDNEI